MSYIYANGMGYEAVTAYGTLPEAQEYVADEFDLPYYPPIAVVRPPLSPRHRRWVAWLTPRRRRLLR
jgi:hypothetical protein